MRREWLSWSVSRSTSCCLTLEREREEERILFTLRLLFAVFFPLNPRRCTVNTRCTRVDAAGSPHDFYGTVYKIIAHPLIWRDAGIYLSTVGHSPAADRERRRCTVAICRREEKKKRRKGKVNELSHTRPRRAGPS